MNIMEKYRSVYHCTSNERGEEEISIEYENGLWRSLLKKPEIKLTFVGGGTVWYNKETGERCSTSMEYQLVQLKKWIQYHGNFARG